MINGIINVYKEKGFTSFDVVAKMRGIFHQKKIGHTGTLDPDAEGVLPVCLGKATKVCDLLTDKDKEYKAVLLLGIETDTQDISGEVLNQKDVHVTEDEVKETILSYVGMYEQIPPMYSALKVNGQKLCDLARKGITVERKSRPVTIHSIEIVSMQLREVEMVVHCSKLTYIRTVCDDIGKKLGTYGCMKSLLRTRVAHFTLENAYTLSKLQELVQAPECEWDFVENVDSVFTKYTAVIADASAEKFIRNGNRIPSYMIKVKESSLDFVHIEEEEYCKSTFRLYDCTNKFIGLYTYIIEDKEFKPIKLFMD